MNSKQLKGLAVISIKDGEKLGTINQVFLDPGAKRVVGFGLQHGGGGLMSSAETAEPELIDVDDVHAVGPDAVTLSDKGAVRGDQTRARRDQLMELDELTKLKTVTEGGTGLGSVASAEIDDRSFALSELEVSAGFFSSNRHIPIGQVVSIGHDLLVVHDAVAAEESASESGTTPAGESGSGRFVVGDVKPSE